MKYQLIFLVIFLTACANFTTADKEIKSGVAEAALFSIEYSDEESQVISSAIKKYIHFRDVWSYFDGLDYALSNDGEQMIYADYEDLRQSYIKLEAVVAANFSRYDEETQKRLVYYQAEARKLDEDMSQRYSVGAVKRYADILLRITSTVM